MISINNRFKVLIPVAGKGTRTGLNYPKSLFKIKGVPILYKIINSLKDYDKNPTLIVSEFSVELIKKFMVKYNLNLELIIQKKQYGMGDAVLHFQNSKFYNKCDNLILIWGDIPFMQKSTIHKTIKTHIEKCNDFTFPTIISDEAYTLVKRNKNGLVKEVLETKELNIKKLTNHERELGFFIFNPKIIFKFLSLNLQNKIGVNSKEHGFLYVIKHLCDTGYLVDGINIGQKKDEVSFNRLEEISDYI